MLFENGTINFVNTFLLFSVFLQKCDLNVIWFCLGPKIKGEPIKQMHHKQNKNITFLNSFLNIIFNSSVWPRYVKL